MKFRFWPEKQPAPEEGHDFGSQGTDEMIVNELSMETSFEDHWQFTPEASSRLDVPEYLEVMPDDHYPEKSWEREHEQQAEQLHLPVPLPEPENVVNLADVRRQKEEAEAAFDPQEMMTFTPEGDVGFEDSYAESLSRYRREVIRDGAKFTRNSINSLVEGYFRKDED